MWVFKEELKFYDWESILLNHKKIKNKEWAEIRIISVIKIKKEIPE